MILRLALRNILRHKIRTAITAGAVAVSVVALMLSAGFVEDIFFQLGEAVIHAQSGHLQVAKHGYLEHGSQTPDKFYVDGADMLKKQIGALPLVDQVSGRLRFQGLLSNGKTDFGITAEGVEPDAERRAGTYLHIAAGRELRASDRFGVLVGDVLAKALGVRAGDPITLVAQTTEGAINSAELQVIGTFSSFSKEYDARTIKLPLDAAQDLLNTSNVTALVVFLHDTRQTGAALQAVNVLLPSGSFLYAYRWEKMNDFYEKTVNLYQRQLGVLQLIIGLMVLTGVANTVNTSIYERIGEVGTMRAIGDRTINVFALLVLEALLIGMLASAAGVVGGAALARAISVIGLAMPPPPNSNLGYLATIRVNTDIALRAFAICSLATVLACILAALRVSRMPVVDALRQNA